MSSRTRLSIAMTTYNGGAYVREQLESFAAQTRLPDELVVCDDVSTDDTVSQVEAFASTAPFEVRIERNPTNLTTTPNFEKAIGLCTGDVIFLSDQDDVWMPEKLEAVAEHFDAHPRAGALFVNGQVCNERLEPLGHDMWEAQWFHPDEQERVRAGRATEVFVKHVVASGNTLAFRGRYKSLVLPFPDLHDCADAWIAFLIASVSDFDILDRDLIRYRVHGQNQFGMHRHSLLEQFERARWQISAGIFDHGITLFSAIEERLRAQTDPELRASEETLALVRGKIDHYTTRNGMTRGLFHRLPRIVRELRAGNYGRYSYGLKSVAQDLVLRSFTRRDGGAA